MIVQISAMRSRFATSEAPCIHGRATWGVKSAQMVAKCLQGGTDIDSTTNVE